MKDYQCKVELLHHTPLYIGALGARTCWDSGDKSDTKDCQLEALEEAILDDNYGFNAENITGPKDAALIERVGNKFKHASILEHISYNFYISDISRALLQEIARHRIASLSVKSTRYTLKELKEEPEFVPLEIDADNFYQSALLIRASKYLISAGVVVVDVASISALENLRRIIISGVSNDRAKYCLPEAYKTELTWSINARSLQNFLYLRTDKSALWEIRELAESIHDALPEDHKYLFVDHLKTTIVTGGTDD